MSMKMMNAAYLVDNVALLSLQEKQDGVEFHCFDMDSKVQTAEGHIGWDVLDKQPFSTLEESARMAALQKIPQLDWSCRCTGSSGDAGAGTRRQKDSLADEKG